MKRVREKRVKNSKLKLRRKNFKPILLPGNNNIALTKFSKPYGHEFTKLAGLAFLRLLFDKRDKLSYYDFYSNDSYYKLNSSDNPCAYADKKRNDSIDNIIRTKYMKEMQRIYKEMIGIESYNSDQKWGSNSINAVSKTLKTHIMLNHIRILLKIVEKSKLYDNLYFNKVIIVNNIDYTQELDNQEFFQKKLKVKGIVDLIMKFAGRKHGTLEYNINNIKTNYICQ